MSAICAKNMRFLPCFPILQIAIFGHIKVVRADVDWVLWGFIRDVIQESCLGVLYWFLKENSVRVDLVFMEGMPFFT